MADLDRSVLASSLSVARALLERALDPIVLIAQDGRIAYVNAAGREWFASAPGSSGPLAAGEVYLDRLRHLGPDPSADLAAVGEALRAILNRERVTFQHDCPCGSAEQTRWLRISISAGDFDQGQTALVCQRDITAQRHREQELADEVERLKLFKSLTSDALSLSENGILLDCNDALCRLIGYTREELIGQRVDSVVTPEDRERVREHMRQNLEEPYEHRATHKDGTQFYAAITGRKLIYQGRAIRGTSIRDLTALKLAERALNAAQEEKLRAQATLLAELSTPLIPLNESALVMPLIGSLDSQRAQQVLQTLLTGIEERRTRIVIIDITGVRLVDSHVASTLVQAAKASRLLGAQVVLTGIRAEVAQTLVRLGVSLDDLTIKATLQNGIAYAFAQNV